MSRVTWLSINTFKKCNATQKTLFLKHYGNSSEESMNEIINLYKELDLPKLYKMVEDRFESELLNKISQLPEDAFPHELFYWLINNLKQRLIRF